VGGLGRLWLWLPTTGLVPTFLLLVFPDGRLLSRRWRPALWYGAFAIGVFTTTVALAPGPLYGAPSVTNPVSPLFVEVAFDGTIQALFVIFFLAVLLAIAALVRRSVARLALSASS